MKDLKRIISLFLAMFIVSGTITPVFASDQSLQTVSFSPESIGNLIVWYDADSINTTDVINTTEGAIQISSLVNKAASGAGLDAVQNNSANQPVYIEQSSYNGKPAIRLSPGKYFQIGGDNGFDLTDMTIVAVMNPNSLSQNSQICSRKLPNSGDHNWYFNIEGGGADLNFGWKADPGGWAYPANRPKLSVNTNYTIVARKDGGNGSIFINGDKQADFSEGEVPKYNSQKVFLGFPSNYADGEVSVDADICEFMIFDRGLSDAEIEQVNNYIGEKWGSGTPENDLNGITVNGVALEGFSPTTYVYNHLLPEGTAAVPAVTATSGTAGAQINVVPATSLPGETTINVIYNGIVRTYRIMFSVFQKELLNLKQPAIEDVQITDGFWKPKLDLFRTTTINHIFDNFERTGSFTNFDKVANGERNTHSQSGSTDPWNDGLVYEAIRGASDYMRQQADPAMEARIDGYIDRIYAAAMTMDDGYLSTWSVLDTDNKRFDEVNALWYHDAYNFGCLCEAAVHYYKATGKTKLLYVATRFAEYMADNFGEGKINMVPSHQGPEEMLFKLYELYRDNPQLKDIDTAGQSIRALNVDENEYRKLVEFWLENRGNYKGRTTNTAYENYGVYAQDHALYYNQTEALGHSVRANLFYNGLAAVGRGTGNTSYLSAADVLWNNIVDKQQYITGGVGATNDGQEAYAGNYVLPNNGYCETCAQVAMGFFDQSMLLAFGNSKYADNLEKEIYNGVLGCVGSNGTSFFYQQRLTANNYDRWTWTDHTPCCPPMFSKFFSELPSYIYSYSDDAIYANQFISSNADIKFGSDDISIEQATTMPWAGATNFQFNLTGAKTFNFNIRIPNWSESTDIQVNGETVQDYAVVNGYAVINRTWRDGDRVDVNFAMTAKREYSNPYVTTNNGKVALTYGPLVYCLEGVDNKIAGISNPLDAIALPQSSQLNTQFEAGLLGGIQTITLTGLYYNADGAQQSLKVKAIPFYARANRGTSSTLVWIDENKAAPKFSPGKLYKIINKKSGKALSAGTGTANATVLTLNDYNETPDQVWRIAFQDNGNYKLINQNSRKIASCLNGATANGTLNTIYDDVDATDQYWQISDGSSGYYKIINQRSNTAMSCKNGGTANGTQIHLWTYLGGAEDQDWAIVDTGISNPADVTAKAEAAGTDSVKLTWEGSAGEITGHNIYMSLALNGTYYKIATVDKNTLSYTNTGLNSDRTYYYKVTSVNGQYESLPSEIVSAKTDVQSQAPAGNTFVNPAYSGADPFVTKGPDGYYYSVLAAGTEIWVYKSKSLTDRGIKRTVWTAPASGMYSKELWAPEIHHLNGKWYIYVAADDGNNVNHRMFCLESDSTDAQGTYTMKGKVTSPDDKWAIDGTVFRKSDGSLYFLWSGCENNADMPQRIYIAPMSDPWTISGNKVMISSPAYPWEQNGASLNEGPEVIERDGKIILTYSSSGSWTADYCLGMSVCSDGDVLNPASWVKSPDPVFSRSGNVYGPGHHSFVKSPDDTQDWIVYHSSVDPGGSWNRCISMKQFTWNADGTPNLGTPIQWGASMALPSGEPAKAAGITLLEDFAENKDRWQEFNIGENLLTIENGEYSIDAMQDSSFGDKALIRGYEYGNFTLESDIKIINGQIDGDLVFRTREAAVGIDSFKGYIAGLNVNGYLEVGRSDGSIFTSLAKYNMTVDKNKTYHMKVIADGSSIKVFVDDMQNPKISVQDSVYTIGQVGVRAVNSHVHYDNFMVAPLQNTSQNPITISTAKTDVTTYGGSNGSITVTAYGIAGVYEYSFDNGQTWQDTNVITGLKAGTYVVIARDKANPVNKSEAGSVIIGQPGAPSNGDNGSQGPSGSSGSSTTGTAAPVPAVTNADLSVHVGQDSVTVTISAKAKSDRGGIAAAAITGSQIAEAVKRAAEAAVKNGKDTGTRLEIKIAVPTDARAIETSLPKAAFDKVAENKSDALIITTAMASISFDKAAIKTISREAGEVVKITASRADVSALSEEARQAAGDRPVLNFSVAVGDKAISEFGGNVIVSLPYVPKAGEDTNAIVVYYINVQGKPEIVSNCVYNKATGMISFKTKQLSKYAVGYNKVEFKDVTAGALYSEAVSFIAARGITAGTGNANFGPEGKLSRGQFLTMVMKTYGIKADENPSANFADAGNKYYTGYLAAAKRLGLSDGVGNNMFAPDKEITRQEMLTLLCNILKQIGELPAGTSGKSLDQCSDRKDIAAWAKPAIAAFIETGVISLKGGKIVPKETAGRAEMAQVLYNLITKQ